MITALVSGGNRGLGYGIVRRLANEFPTSSPYGSSSEKLTIYLGSRDVGKGEDAKKSIQSELTQYALDRVSIEVCQLDTASHESIVKLASHLKPGVDILINNSGVALDGFDADVVKNTLAINYYAVQDMINNVPVKEGGKIINIASSTGVLRNVGDDVRDRFRNAKTVQDVDALMRDFHEAVADGTWKEKGWKGSAYATSKSGVIAYTRALAQQYQQQGNKVQVFSCCPGCKYRIGDDSMMCIRISRKSAEQSCNTPSSCSGPCYHHADVNTDMTKGKGHKTLDQGAETPVLLALQAEAKPGEFWYEKKPYDWELRSSN